MYSIFVDRKLGITTLVQKFRDTLYTPEGKVTKSQVENMQKQQQHSILKNNRRITDCKKVGSGIVTYFHSKYISND